MQTIRERLRNTPVGGAWGSLKSFARVFLPWHVSPRGRKSHKSLEMFRNRHQGERAFILGNGPSINRTDLSPLKNEWTFATNRFYLKFSQTDFRPSYYAVVNEHVITQFIQEIAELPMPKFLTWNLRHIIPDKDGILLYPQLRRSVFSPDPTRGISAGYTVTFICMQLAFFMGFKSVYLLGVDHYFETKGQANLLVTSQSDDPNHFHPSYFGVGVRWQLPDLEASEQSYRMAKSYYEAHDRCIYDATIGGHLQVFPKVDYASLFN